MVELVVGDSGSRPVHFYLATSGPVLLTLSLCSDLPGRANCLLLGPFCLGCFRINPQAQPAL